MSREQGPRGAEMRPTASDARRRPREWVDRDDALEAAQVSAHATLLVELLTEELPPAALRALGETFAGGLAKALSETRLAAAPARFEWYATPRRLAVSIAEVRAQADARRIERRIMPRAVALDAQGRPTAALAKKLASAGIAPERAAALECRTEGRTEMLYYCDTVPGATLDACLAPAVEAALRALPIPKLMRWGEGDAQFVRPAHALVLLHGTRVVPGTVLGLAAGNLTRGHRLMCPGELVIREADAYEAVLEREGRVIASFSRRRECIRTALEGEAARLGARLDGCEALLDEVTALTEYPAVYAGRFDAQFLEVPQECLILTMRQNQKYFPLFDANGRLTNRFLIVSNLLLDDPAAIIRGNERVVRPRLADARFFFEQDRATRLAERVPALARVVYHNRLGSQFDRANRLRRLAGAIARRLHCDVQAAERAAWLAKADLLTGMVGEFPELQGIMGRYYALADGEPVQVADAIGQHYRPRFAGDSLPEGNIACAVALADKLDTLFGLFAIGAVPTGERDPFGLRRAALGVLRMLVETPLPLDLAELVDEAAQGFAGTLVPADDARARLIDFLLERLRHLLREAGHPAERIEAVLALRPMRVDLVPAKLAAVAEFAGLPEAQALCAANKRIVNILKKADGIAAEVDVLLFQEPAERDLFRNLSEAVPVVRSLVAGEDYTGALKRLAGLRAAVDALFDNVMVMAEEPLTRANRLALLRDLAQLMNQVADLSRLST